MEWIFSSNLSILESLDQHTRLPSVALPRSDAYAHHAAVQLKNQLAAANVTEAHLKDFVGTQGAQFLLLSDSPQREEEFKRLRMKHGSIFAFHGSRGGKEGGEEVERKESERVIESGRKSKGGGAFLKV